MADAAAAAFVPVHGHAQLEVSECGRWARSRFAPAELVDLNGAAARGGWVRLMLDPPPARRARLVRADELVPSRDAAGPGADEGGGGGCEEEEHAGDGEGSLDGRCVEDVSRGSTPPLASAELAVAVARGRRTLMAVSLVLVALAVAVQVHSADREGNWGRAALGYATEMHARAERALANFAAAVADRGGHSQVRDVHFDSWACDM